jgi:hypothetical protein
MKIHPVGTELFHADGQTDMMQPIVAYRNFAKGPNKIRPLARLNGIEACCALAFKPVSCSNRMQGQSVWPTDMQ